MALKRAVEMNQGSTTRQPPELPALLTTKLFWQEYLASNIRFVDLTDDAAGIPSGKDSVWDISRNDTPRANDNPRPDANAGKNERSTAHPNI